MIVLEDCLSQLSHRFLLAICWAHHLNPPRGASKAALVRFLRRSLMEGDTLGHLLHALSPSALEILSEINLAGGSLPARYIFRRYGAIRPYRPWRRDAPRRPWETPVSDVERLWFLGLIFIDSKTDQVLLPAEFVVLAEPSISHTASADSSGQIDRLTATRLDLACLLGLLQRKPVTRLRGRWFPPHFLVEWGRWCIHLPEVTAPRSELQTRRRRFIHFLAEQGGFVQRGQSQLSPAPPAWVWMKLDATAQAKALWHTWLNAGGKRRRRFRLPGADWLNQLARLVTPLNTFLLSLPPNQAQPARHIAQSFLRACPDLLDLVPASADDPAEILIDTVIGLFRGPLTWLGLLNGAVEDRVSLSDWGRALLANQPFSAPSPEPPFSLTFRPACVTA